MTTPNRHAANIFLNVLKLQDAGFFCTFTYHTEVSTDDDTAPKPSLLCLAIYNRHNDFLMSITDPLKVVVSLPDQYEKLCDDLEDFLNDNPKPQLRKAP